MRPLTYLPMMLPVVDQPQDEDQQNRQQHAVDDLRDDDQRISGRPGISATSAPRTSMPVKRPLKIGASRKECETPRSKPKDSQTAVGGGQRQHRRRQQRRAEQPDRRRAAVGVLPRNGTSACAACLRVC